MTKFSSQKHSRRELIAAVARYASLGLLAAGGGSLLARRRRSLREGKCINNGPGRSGCRGCKILGGCGLPQAISAKRVLGGGDAGK